MRLRVQNAAAIHRDGTVQPTSVLTALLALVALLVVGLSTNTFRAPLAAAPAYASLQAALPGGSDRCCDGPEDDSPCCHGQSGPGGGLGWYAPTVADIPAPDVHRPRFTVGGATSLSGDAMEPAVPPPRLTVHDAIGTRIG